MKRWQMIVAGSSLIILLIAFLFQGEVSTRPARATERPAELTDLTNLDGRKHVPMSSATNA